MSEKETHLGVQELIDRLSQEGVAAGEKQAEHILAASRREAERVLDDARQQAKELLQRARDDADQYQAAGEEALRLAARDAVREFGSRVHDGLRTRLQSLVSQRIQDPQIVEKMILEISRQSTTDAGDSRIELLVPPDIISEEDALQRLQAGDPDVLTDFLQGVIGEDLREGFTIQLGKQGQHGLTVRVVNENVEIDLTEQSIAELLSHHLLPRFRAIMRA